MELLDKRKNATKELMLFKGDDSKKFIITVYKHKESYTVILTDEYAGIKNKKIYQSMSMDTTMVNFHKAINIYSNRLKKSR